MIAQYGQGANDGNRDGGVVGIQMVFRCRLPWTGGAGLPIYCFKRRKCRLKTKPASDGILIVGFPSNYWCRCLFLYNKFRNYFLNCRNIFRDMLNRVEVSPNFHCISTIIFCFKVFYFNIPVF